MNFRPGLYIVSTPIGNLNDITIRALENLKNSDIILCEDTRISAKLLAKHNITGSLSIYNDKSDETTRKYIIKNIEAGKVVSLISDAGTPLISDPGYKLVREVKEKGYFIDIAPGVSAPIAALTLSGLPSDRFIFAGFLPKTDIGREKVFLEFAEVDATLIFFDRSTRIVDSLQAALKILGNREANVSRELTKLFQESRTVDIESLIKYYSQNLPKGEIVLLISGKKSLESSEEKLITEIKNLLILGTHTKDITQQLFQKYHKHYKKSKIYKICNSLKGTKHRI
ncbi:MAG: 16S rRNA (cytidine(1402)-2'-O)-methyltransferase [Candidatus Megaira endosymbiont of Carteria cerasiformis]|jgi:16S rRNA (cytidine1402-2'-O)-methyltransferase|uniref:16S rRNA (cytidine(1402)-2'-O)-methyltransferase n=1 Tax=Candidatus Megaera polyxenophila TaxID=988779 RepID=UPI001CC36239|nr:16S rRNA (cytidine(1402)-2'-O)-methyltransferase [Candidatus Megaera polyxenophila]MCC8460469.1 16S rRNA (cytidine(1402)-2'-O)-methyltransferase [Candidatus Megaera polyxenophila]WHA06846.1 16S rRNA (cytidine(1402)-2'-O)-methyltransferase [Candidatus Megaera polyxenophila]